VSPAGQPFRRTATDVVAADGTARATLVPPGRDWLITMTTTSTSTNTLIPTAKIYVNGVFVEGSDSGSLDSSDTKRLIRANDEYESRWAGADVGARATLTVEGYQYLPGQAPVV